MRRCRTSLLKPSVVDLNDCRYDAKSTVVPRTRTLSQIERNLGCRDYLCYRKLIDLIMQRQIDSGRSGRSCFAAMLSVGSEIRKVEREQIQGVRLATVIQHRQFRRILDAVLVDAHTGNEDPVIPKSCKQFPRAWILRPKALDRERDELQSVRIHLMIC